MALRKHILKLGPGQEALNNAQTTLVANAYERFAQGDTVGVSRHIHTLLCRLQISGAYPAPQVFVLLLAALQKDHGELAEAFHPNNCSVREQMIKTPFMSEALEAYCMDRAHGPAAQLDGEPLAIHVSKYLLTACCSAYDFFDDLERSVMNFKEIYGLPQQPTQGDQFLLTLVAENRFSLPPKRAKIDFEVLDHTAMSGAFSRVVLSLSGGIEDAVKSSGTLSNEIEMSRQYEVAIARAKSR